MEIIRRSALWTVQTWLYLSRHQYQLKWLCCCEADIHYEVVRRLPQSCHLCCNYDQYENRQRSFQGFGCLRCGNHVVLHLSIWWWGLRLKGLARLTATDSITVPSPSTQRRRKSATCPPTILYLIAFSSSCWCFATDEIFACRSYSSFSMRSWIWHWFQRLLVHHWCQRSRRV